MERLFGRLTTLEAVQGEYVTKIYEWEWQQGVALYATYKLFKQSGDKRYMDFIQGWYKRMLAEGMPERNVNTTAPFLAMAFLAEDGVQCETDFHHYVTEHAEWIMKKFPRTTDGGFQHLTREYIHREHIWCDTIYMTVLFLAKAGKYLGKQEYIDEAIYQTMVHIKYLTETRSGLFLHGWSFLEKEKNIGRTLWARGNSWITMGIPELLEILGESIEESTKRYFINAYKRQVEALIEYQTNDGMWHTVIDNPNSYVETSATAAFACGILKGIDIGILDQEFSFNAFMGIRYIVDNFLDVKGNLGNVSYGTPIGSDEKHYLDIPFSQCPYGQTNVLLALIELKDTKYFHEGFVMPWKDEK